MGLNLVGIQGRCPSPGGAVYSAPEGAANRRAKAKRRRERGAKRAGSKLVLALGVEELVGAVAIGFRHEDLGGAAQIAVVRRGEIHERLRGGVCEPRRMC